MPSRHAYIIGRGIVGLATAFALQRRGLRVTIVGPAARPGSASRAAVGTSTLKGNILATSPLFALKLRGHAYLVPWLRLVEQASGRRIAQDFFGAIEPFYNQKEYVYQRQRIFHRQFTGCFALKVLPRPELLQRFSSGGAFPNTASGAFHYFRDGWFDPRACLEALELALEIGGATFVSEPVMRVSPRPEGGQIIHTAAGDLVADETVVAAGVFSDDILAASGFTGIRQELVEGETLVYPTQLDDVVLKMGKMNLVVHARTLFVGSSSRRQPNLEACLPSHGAAEELSALAAAQLAPSTAFSVRCGVRGRFKDHCPAIGSLKWSNCSQQLWVATGFYKNGLQLGPLFAEALADRLAMPVTPNLSTILSTAFPMALTSILQEP